jgi:hypothetical protein
MRVIALKPFVGVGRNRFLFIVGCAQRNDHGNTAAKVQLNLWRSRFARGADYRFNIALSYKCGPTTHFGSLNQQISV